jgi:transposase
LRNFWKSPLNKLDDLFGRLQRSLRKWKDAVFAFLYNPDLPSDNNGSERAIRKTKIKMKVSQCFRSEKGAEAFAVLHSLMETAKKNGQSAFNVLRTIASTGQWTPDCAR